MSSSHHWLPGCRRAGLLLAVLFLLPEAREAVAADGLLRVESLRIRFSPGERPSGRVRLSAGLPTEILPAAYSLEEDGVTVEIGGVVAASFRPVETGVQVRERAWWLHDLRARRAPGRAPGRLVLDRGHGRIELRSGPLDVSGIREAGPHGLSVVVRLGETTFSTTLDLTESSGRFEYVSPPGSPIPPRPGPPPGPSGPALRILDTGLYSAIHAGETAVARNWTEYGALWARHHPPVPPGLGVPDVGPPNVDFATEIVVAVFLGDRSNGETATVLAVAAAGTGAAVTWAEVLLGPGCPVPMYVQMPSPYALAAISRVAGTVTFSKQTTVRNCP